MYDSKRIRVKKDDLTKEYILSKVSDYDIYTKYIGNFKVGAVYNSPLRKDRNPSFGIYWSKKHNCLYFKDYGTGEFGDVFRFVSLYTGITDYKELLHRIIDDLQITKNTILTNTYQYVKPAETIIGIVRQNWTDVDKEYWSQFHITMSTLKKYKVYSIKYYLCNGVVKGIYRDENPMYAYKVNNHFKIYRPLADKYAKWRNNLTKEDIQGYKQLPDNGELLIITKSLKDVMVLYEMGYNAISPSSETTFIPNESLEALERRFKRILLCFDRDNTGVRNMRSTSLKTGLNGFLVHKKFHSKDISDAVKNNGYEIVKQWLVKTLEEKGKN